MEAHTENPHEQQQRQLVQRIVRSVGRLNEVVQNLNSEMEQLEQCKPELEHVNEVLYGYSRKVHANTQA